MYRVSIPFLVYNPRFEEYYEAFVQKCREAGVSRVFLCLVMAVDDEKKKEKDLRLMKRYVPKLKSLGFEVGAWFSSLGHGYGGIEQGITEDARGITYAERLEGGANISAYCPLDPKFSELFCDWIQRIAETGVSMIMLDDDYRYAIKGGTACCCKNHRALLEKELGEPFDRSRMIKALKSGGPNRYRDAWLKVQGESLTDFAKMLRRALDEVNPRIRLAHCACLSTWDIDGVDSITLAKTFAGETRPFMRLIGAPYWAPQHAFRQVRLGTICEYERLQQAWCKESGVEIICEGDVYPRPTYNVPAAYLEGFDQVMRASGTSDGILKYMFDYTASPDYETGYLEKHMEDSTLFETLERVFAEKEATGVTVFEPMKTYALSHAPGEPEDRCIPASLRFVTDNNLPVCYEGGQNAVVIFGDSAECAAEEQLKHGAVLDATAAEILTRRGFDVGIEAFGEQFHPSEEYYVTEKETVASSGGEWAEMVLREGTMVQSWLTSSEGKAKIPASYTYENGSGQKFLVYAFRAQTSFETGVNRGVFRSWCRAAQLRRLLPWLSGHSLDAVCNAAPDLYILTKRSERELTVGLWNFSVDWIAKPVVHLGEEWKELICEWGNAHMEGRTVTLEKLPAFGCVCFTLKK